MNDTRRVRFLARLCLCCACMLATGVAASAALGQSPATAPAPLRPPTPGAPTKPPAVMNFLTAALIVAIVLGAAFIPAKRTHQD